MSQIGGGAAPGNDASKSLGLANDYRTASRMGASSGHHNDAAEGASSNGPHTRSQHAQNPVAELRRQAGVLAGGARVRLLIVSQEDFQRALPASRN